MPAPIFPPYTIQLVVKNTGTLVLAQQRYKLYKLSTPGSPLLCAIKVFLYAVTCGSDNHLIWPGCQSTFTLDVKRRKALGVKGRQTYDYVLLRAVHVA